MTIFFSQDSASIAAVILTMNKLDTHLNLYTHKLYHPTIQAVMRLACNKLNQYYSMTDLLSVYQIAIGKQKLVPMNSCSATDIKISPSSRTEV